MDIDTTRSKGGVPPSMCRCCRKSGYWACSCPEGLNMHYLSANKQDMLIIELLAAKDASSIPSPKAMDSKEDGEEDILEDF